MTNTNEGYTINQNSITIFYGGKIVTIDKGHAKAEDIIKLLRKGYLDLAYNMADMATAIQEYAKGAVKITNGELFYGNDRVDNSLTRRIVKMWEEGDDFSSMVKFLDNLQLNPSQRAVNELYRFLEANSLPITDDGHFLAYKKVNSNYKDFHSGTFDNRVGSVCRMDRNKVNDNPNETCSTGLHFCSQEYLKSMYGGQGHLMVVKVHPRDVVSIPVDYNNSKGRCCKYTVVSEKVQDTTWQRGDVFVDDFETAVVYLQGWDKGYDKGYDDGYSEANEDWLPDSQ